MLTSLSGYPTQPVLPGHAGGYYASPLPAAMAPPAQASPGSVPVQPTGNRRGSPLWVLDVGKMVAHPIQTIRDLVLLTGEVMALTARSRVALADAGPALAAYRVARERLEQCTFRYVFPVFEALLNRWAIQAAAEFKPEVETRLAAAAWHPITIEWPNGGQGHQCLNEVLLIDALVRDLPSSAWVRGAMGANRIQFKNSSLMDYFYPVTREGDALVLRRPLPLIPGQQSLGETLRAHLMQATQVEVQLMPPAPF